MMAYDFNHSTHEAETETCEFQTLRGYTARICLKRRKKKNQRIVTYKTEDQVAQERGRGRTQGELGVTSCEDRRTHHTSIFNKHFVDTNHFISPIVGEKGTGYQGLLDFLLKT